MSLKSKFGTVKNAETEGAWITVEYNDDGTPIRFKVRRSGYRNKDYTRSLNKGLKPYANIKPGELDPEIDAKIMRRVLFESIVTEWENVRNEEGVEMAFNQTNLERILIEYPDLQAEIIMAAGRIETFQDQALEAEAKN